MVVELIVYRVIMVNFQDIENQRVERNIRRVSAIIDDRLSQLSLKLTDWTNWDDTYKFMSDENIEYQISNLPVNAFEGIGVDQTLFINKNEEIIWTVDVLKNLSSKEVDLSNEMNQYFASGSALLKIDKEIGLNQGILKTKEGLILFVVREVFHSGGEGESNGKMVFGKYLDKEILNSMKDLTQFEAQIYFWDDPKIPADYLSIKNGYRNGEKELVKILDDQTISGYQVIEDVYGKEQAIIRSDINRDIVLRGKSSMILLIYLLIFTGILTVIINYLLVSRLILKKILLAIRDVGNLGRPGFEFKRLEAGHGVDEVDKLRVGINEMIDSLEEEKQKGESLLDLINAVVVRLNAKGEVSMINKYGLKKLGYSEEEVLGKNWLDNFLSPESREKISGVVGALLKEEIEENKEVENEILTKDGKRLLISWHNTVIKDIEGKVTSILSVGDDITQKREEEEKKERYSQELERLNRVMVGRELKMVELKKEINNLKNKK
jgi:PAS domain S-box-containing protein